MSSEDIEHLDFPTDDGEERPDPTEIARLDQEQQAYNDSAKLFAQTYGFVHDCRCSEDVAEGNVREVPQCFLRMVSYGMAACAAYFQESNQLRLYLNYMLKMNNDLVEMLQDRGYGEDLEKYFSEDIELEKPEESESVEDTDQLIDTIWFEPDDNPDDDEDNGTLAIV